MDATLPQQPGVYSGTLIGLSGWFATAGLGVAASNNITGANVTGQFFSIGARADQLHRAVVAAVPACAAQEAVCRLRWVDIASKESTTPQGTAAALRPQQRALWRRTTTPY